MEKKLEQEREEAAAAEPAAEAAGIKRAEVEEGKARRQLQKIEDEEMKAKRTVDATKTQQRMVKMTADKRASIAAHDAVLAEEVPLTY